MDKLVAVAVFASTIFLYPLLNMRKSTHYWESNLDSRIPAIPAFVIPYLLFFIYVPACIYLLYDHPLFSTMMFVLISGNLFNAVFWFVFPNGVKRPKLNTKGRLVTALNLVYYYDNDTNGCPSSHVFMTVAVTYYMIMAFAWLWPVFSAIALSIIFSVIFTKQHNLVDILGGLMTFVVCAGVYSLI